MSENRVTLVWVRDAAIAGLALSVFFGAIGPFGDYTLVPVWARVTTWMAIGLIGVGIFAAILRGLGLVVPGRNWTFYQVITAIVGAAILTPIVSLLDRLISGDMTGGFGATYVIVLPVSALYLVLFEAVRLWRCGRMSATTDGGGNGHETAVPKIFLRRLPAGFTGKLLCLEKEDHYLRVHTDDGNFLIRLRMSDAMAELEHLPGLQTHRSWWVAEHAVLRAKRRKTGGGEAMLSNGLTVPIARSRIADIQAAGWFDK